MAQTIYSIRRWDEIFENSQSRQHRRLSWVPVPNKHDGKSYRRLIARENGLALYGAWCLMVQVASKCPVRGVLADEDGPLDAEDLAAKTGGSAQLFAEAFELLSQPKLGWLTVVTPTAEQQHANSAVQDSASEQNRPVQNRKEQLPVPGAGVSPKRSGKASGKSVFAKLKGEHLSQCEMLNDWFEFATAEALSPLFANSGGNSEANLLFVFAAAERAIEHGDSPLKLFRAIVGKEKRDLITHEQEDRARSRLARLRSVSPTPAQ